MERRLAAILACDVVGYSRAMRVDETGTLERLKTCRRELIDPRLARYRGRVIKLMGDGALVEFASAVDSVSFAVSMQHALAEWNARLDPDERLLFRLGINVGDVIVDGADIYGDGVNVASRLEGLAEPGGICVRRNVRNQVRDNLDLDYEDLGEVEVKNIDRPIRAFRIVMNEKAAALAVAPIAELDVPVGHRRRWRAGAALAAALLVGAGLTWIYLPIQIGGSPNADVAEVRKVKSEKSLIVLPLDNLSDDPAQKYFADGLTEDLTTDLSQIPDLFVIARSSAFAYAKKGIDARKIGQELGVRYIIEGSVRRLADLLRINIQLIDGRTGSHVWAERFDGSPDDVLAFQDKIMQRVVASLSLRFDAAARERSRQAETKDPRAFDAFLEGWEHYIRRTPEDYAAAIKHFKRAIELDPHYGRAHAALASTYWEGFERWWHKQMGFDEWIEPRRAAETHLAIAMKRPTALAHQVAAEIRRVADQPEDMLVEARAAVALDPNDPNSYSALTMALTVNGRPAEAMAAVDKAMALDPEFPAFYLYLKGHVHFEMRDYQTAAGYFERALKRNPANFTPNLFLIATYARLGKIDDAKALVAAYPTPLSIDWIDYYFTYKENEDWDHFADSFRLAGVPEVATKIPPPPKN